MNIDINWMTDAAPDGERWRNMTLTTPTHLPETEMGPWMKRAVDVIEHDYPGHRVCCACPKRGAAVHANSFIAGLDTLWICGVVFHCSDHINASNRELLVFCDEVGLTGVTKQALILNACRTCGNPSRTLKACAGCVDVMYCNATCQQADWARHKLICKVRV